MAISNASEHVALITGAGRGIGRSIALALSAIGWTTIVNELPDAAGNAHSVAEEIKASGGKACVILADIAKPNERSYLVNQAVALTGTIDLLVNNAGVAPRVRTNILEVNEESYDEVMAINLKGPFFLTQRVANLMIGQRQERQDEQPNRASGAIVNIGSLNAYTSSPNRGEYCLSKAGIGMMTKLFAEQLAPFGINVYEIRPGIIQTDMTKVVKDKYDSLIAQGLTPIQRWGQPEDVARAVVAIAQGYLPFSTGEVINVDGGFHLQRL